MAAETIMGSKQFNSFVSKNKVYGECTYFYGDPGDAMYSFDEGEKLRIVKIIGCSITLTDSEGYSRFIPVGGFITELSDKEIRIYDFLKRGLTESEQAIVNSYKELRASDSYKKDKDNLQNLVFTLFESGNALHLMPPEYEKGKLFSDETMSWVGDRKEKGKLLVKYKLTTE